MDSAIENKIENLFDELIEQQKTKVLKVARTLNPHVTKDDILNPHDFPELSASEQFNYEDGILSGLVSAQIAVRARILRVN